jgi:hypothetical protein
MSFESHSLLALLYLYPLDEREREREREREKFLYYICIRLTKAAVSWSLMELMSAHNM